MADQHSERAWNPQTRGQYAAAKATAAMGRPTQTQTRDRLHHYQTADTSSGTPALTDLASLMPKNASVCAHVRSEGNVWAVCCVRLGGGTVAGSDLRIEVKPHEFARKPSGP